MVPSDFKRITGVVLGLAVLPAAGPAMAADLLRLSREPVVLADSVSEASGWYLRGDVTVSGFRKPSDATPPDPNDPGMPPLVGLRLSDEVGYGGGVGYRVNPWLRIDATIDQRAPSRFRTYSSRTNFATGYNVEAGDLDVLTGLVNVYADLGTWWGLTPYLGGGIGFADNGFRGNYTQTTCTEAACDGNPGTGNRTAVARPDHALPSFAWSLTAGLSYRLREGLSLDAAYRYVDLGTAKSGTDPFGGITRLKTLAANELRIGLRYEFASGLLPLSNGNLYGN